MRQPIARLSGPERSCAVFGPQPLRRLPFSADTEPSSLDGGGNGKEARIIVLANGNKVDPISPNLRRYEDFRKKLSYAVQTVSLRARILE
jgi:hypothetical protein